MKSFVVIAFDTKGNKVVKILDAEDERGLDNIIKTQELIPIEVKPLPDIVGLFKVISPFKFSKIKASEIIETFENLHLIVKSGVPIVTGLRDISSSLQNKKFKAILKSIADDINSGDSISNAFMKHENIFGKVITTLIRVGEETGNLDRVLKDASEYLSKVEDLKSKIKQAMIYPTFTFVVVLGSMIFWLVYVLPKMLEAFQGFGIELPLITRIIIVVSNFIKSYLLLIIILIIIGIIVLRILRLKNKKIKLETDKLLLKIPVIGILVTYFNFAFITEYLKLMIGSGVTISRSLEILKDTLNNEFFRVNLEKIINSLSSGKSLSESFKDVNLFSPMIIRMLNIGENTGSLEEQLEYISGYYYKKLDYVSQNISKLIEPILLTVVGIFMLIIILGLIGPIYQLISDINKTS